MTTHKRKTNQRTGAITALVLLFGIILTLLGMATLRVSMHERNFAVRSAHIIAAKAAADSGLTRAVFHFNKMMETQSVDLSLLDVSGESVLNSNATYDYTVSTDGSGGYQIESTGHSQGVARTVRTSLKLRGLYEYAVLTKGQQVLKAGVLIDGYNSQDPSKTDAFMKLATTSILDNKITLNNGSIVDGDVFVGVGGDPATVINDLGGTTGDRTALTEEPPFPVITAPALPLMGSFLIKAETKTLTPADNGLYYTFNVRSGGSARNPLYGVCQVSGGDVVLHITGNLSLQQGCEITVAVDSSLTIYAEADINCGTSSSIGYEGTAKEPKHVTIYGTAPAAQTFDIKAKANFTGTIYAPNADISLNAQGDVYGSFIGNTFEYKANGDFYYDEDLLNVSIDDPGVRLTLDRWSE